NNLNTWKVMLLSVIVMLLLVPFLLWCLSFIFPDLLSRFIDSVLPYALEMIYNFLQSGKLSTVSTDKLSKMYFSVPYDTLLFGDGHWNDPDGVGYYMQTDAGYMRHVLYFGLFPSMILYALYVFLFSRIMF